ncbi:hypothetical protein [Paracoccus sp. NSM]|uniref:hypothetical protein n=1 Tax=Paracoccus sp. NSM TaxID=3457784 RepID=UPI004036D3A2
MLFSDLALQGRVVAFGRIRLDHLGAMALGDVRMQNLCGAFHLGELGVGLFDLSEELVDHPMRLRITFTRFRLQIGGDKLSEILRRANPAVNFSRTCVLWPPKCAGSSRGSGE